MRILQYIACSICSYLCDKYTCLDIWIRAGVLVVEKDHGSGANDPNWLVRLLLGCAAIDLLSLSNNILVLDCCISVVLQFAFHIALEHGIASNCP